jgi:predicted MFS family arabinose efflux permease
VLPSLFGPSLAAWVAAATGWRWVFLGTIGLAAAAALLVSPALRTVERTAGDEPVPKSRLAWAGVGAVAVVALELLGSGDRLTGLLALCAFAVVVLSLRRLLPAGTLAARRGLPAVIGTRGLLSASFFCAEAYVVFVLQDRWGLSTGTAGLALSAVGVTWAAASQLQARLGTRVSHATAMRWGSALLLAGVAGIGLVVWTHVHPALAAAAYVVSGAGMGFGYPRTSVAMLDVSTDLDRGFNSSAISVADSLGAALALSVSGVVFEAADRAGLDPFVAVLAVATAVGVLAVAAAARTRPAVPAV